MARQPPERVARQRRRRLKRWRWPFISCPPALAGRMRPHAVCVLPIVSPRIATELRTFIAEHYPCRRWIVVTGNLLFVLAVIGFCWLVADKALRGGAIGVLGAGIFGILPFALPFLLVYRGYVVGRRLPGDPGVPSIATLRNQVVRPDAAAMLIDLHLAGVRFRDLVAIMQDPFLVLGRFHLALLRRGAPLCVAWFLTFLAASDAHSLAPLPFVDLALFVVLTFAGQRMVVAVFALGVAENLREMLAWLIWSSSEGAIDVSRRLLRLSLRAFFLTILPLAAVASLVLAQVSLRLFADATLRAPLFATSLIVIVFHRRFTRLFYANVLRELRSVIAEGEAVLGAAIARLAEMTR
jgi:hypothetical protein